MIDTLLREEEGRSGDVFTEARVALLWALSHWQTRGAQTTAQLVALANFHAPGLDAEAVEIRGLARLTLASAYQDDGRYRDAIAAYLRVETHSGYFREARIGLASCQFFLERPERALKILALLPGGLSGDPEQALLAAMAAHALNRPADARAIVDVSLRGAPVWRASAWDLERVLERAVESEIGISAERSTRAFVSRLARHPRVLPLARELLATRRGVRDLAGGSVRDVVPYMNALTKGLVSALISVSAHLSRQSEPAFSDLNILRPQLR